MERLIELIKAGDFGDEFQHEIAEIIKAGVKNTEWREIEDNYGNVTHFDCEVKIDEQYFLTWNATSYWYLSENTAKYDEQDDSEWELTGIVLDNFSIYDWNNNLDVCFFDDKQKYYDNI
jgi:hypothetical protein